MTIWIPTTNLDQKFIIKPDLIMIQFKILAQVNLIADAYKVVKEVIMAVLRDLVFYFSSIY